MDPNKVKLNTAQKMNSLLRAIDTEIPILVIVGIGIDLTLAIIITNDITCTIADPILNFIVKRVLCGGALMILVGLILAGLTAIVMNCIVPLVENIRSNYDYESLESKKKILDNVIEDEVLNK